MSDAVRRIVGAHLYVTSGALAAGATPADAIEALIRAAAQTAAVARGGGVPEAQRMADAMMTAMMDCDRGVRS